MKLFTTVKNIFCLRKFPEIVVLDYCGTLCGTQPILGVFDMHDAFFFILVGIKNNPQILQHSHTCARPTLM